MRKVVVKQKGLVMNVSPFMANLLEQSIFYREAIRKQVLKVLKQEALKIDKEIMSMKNE